MERRDEKRRPRRVPVRFWKRGEDKPRTGFTTNISRCGMFIGSHLVHAQGTRVRIEVLDPLHGFVVEGMVARAIRSPAAMQRLKPSGMGVRFLQVAELVEELFPASPHQPGKTSSSEPSSSEPSAETPAAASESTQSVPATVPAYLVQFRNQEEFRQSFERDISQGGLFITTPHPAPLQKVIVIEIRLLEGSTQAVRLQAKVVQCLEPDENGEPNLLAGMGLELLDLEQVKMALQPLLS